MPPVRKIDLVPGELRDRLRRALEERGFGDIVAVTEELNAWLAADGLELRIGKSAVGEFSKLLKDQREAFSIASAVLAETDIDAESELHRVLMQMIGASAVHLIRAIREEEGQIDAKDLHFLSRMLKDLMSSAGIREKLLEDERKRLEKAQAARLEAAVAKGDLDAEAADRARRILGFA